MTDEPTPEPETHDGEACTHPAHLHVVLQVVRRTKGGRTNQFTALTPPLGETQDFEGTLKSLRRALHGIADDLVDELGERGWASPKAGEGIWKRGENGEREFLDPFETPGEAADETPDDTTST